MQINASIVKMESYDKRMKRNIEMFDLACLRLRMLQAFSSKTKMERVKHDASVEFQDDEGAIYYPQDWRRILDRIRRWEYPIDYDNE